MKRKDNTSGDVLSADKEIVIRQKHTLIKRPDKTPVTVTVEKPKRKKKKKIKKAIGLNPFQQAQFAKQTGQDFYGFETTWLCHAFLKCFA